MLNAVHTNAALMCSCQNVGHCSIPDSHCLLWHVDATVSEVYRSRDISSVSMQDFTCRRWRTAPHSLRIRMAVVCTSNICKWLPGSAAVPNLLLLTATDTLRLPLQGSEPLRQVHPPLSDQVEPLQRDECFAGNCAPDSTCKCDQAVSAISARPAISNLC